MKQQGYYYLKPGADPLHENMIEETSSINKIRWQLFKHRDYYDNTGMFKETLWEQLKWKLFGETRIIGWIFIGILTIQIAFWGAVIFIAYHFISKFW